MVSSFSISLSLSLFFLSLVGTRCKRIEGIYCGAPGPFHHFEARSLLRYLNEVCVLLSRRALVDIMRVNTLQTIIAVYHS